MSVIIAPLQLLSSAPDMPVLDLGSKESLARECEPSDIVNLKGSPKQISSVKWSRYTWTKHLSGRILQPSHTQSFAEWWILHLRESLANRTRLLENAKEVRTKDSCSTSGLTDSKSCNLDISSLKTSKDSFQAKCQTVRFVSDTSCDDWRKSDIVLKQQIKNYRLEYSQRKSAVLLTEGSECLSWHTTDQHPGVGNSNSWSRRNGKHRLDTPEAVGKYGQPAPDNHNTSGNHREQSWRTPAVQDPGVTLGRLNVNPGGRMYDKVTGRNAQYGLTQQVQIPKESWATPSTMDMLPPKTGEALARNKKKGGCKNLREDVNKPPTNGKLNARWVETLMNLPIGWTMPSCKTPIKPIVHSAQTNTKCCVNPVTIEPMNCDCSETESCLPQQQKRG